MKEFEHIETLENAVIWDYFKGTLGWPIEQIAYEMNWNTRRLLEWVNQRATVITKLLKADKGKVEAIRKRLKEKYPIPKPEIEQKLKLNIIQVVKKHKEGNSIPELAEIFRCPLNDFRIWWNENLPVINQEFRKERG